METAVSMFDHTHCFCKEDTGSRRYCCQCGKVWTPIDRQTPISFYDKDGNPKITYPQIVD